ncbi:interferon alpha-inducible IFI6/IFI27 family protein [Aspergillus homomorphus CBS 101889]|uniref:Uncharacterized protein n=1 Tax=Aspergillus homomorphus (strain CBS 101889) TaxID=1450537 RepID=A0A395I9U0_ASPHC|nr:hypothetical protein BO97DRAFT_75656 [Aspergillus homomorphus CBS 101889]RAL16791.1 hypothetical protein BO97DRAFT_75656 [Aspergillus homomorphus CBS 101889]
MEYLSGATASVISMGRHIAQEHTTALAVGGTGLALATAPIIGPAVLGAVGFSVSGPVAASFAAVWQSSLGAVQAGSLFATLQGAAMGGAAAGIFTAASNIGIGMTGFAVIETQWTHIRNGLWLKRDGDQSDKTGYSYEDSPIDTTKCMTNNPHMLDGNDLLATEFTKLRKIDMS